MRCEYVWRCAASALGVGVVCASASAGVTFENTVSGFGIFKTGHYVQVSAAVVGTQSYDFLAAFTEENPADHNVQVADFRYVNQDTIPNSVGMLEGPPGVWTWDDPTMFGNESAMDYTYTSANDYTFALTVDGMGVFEEAIDGPSDLYPDVVPRVNDYTALQSVNPVAGVPVTFDGFGNIGGLNLVKVFVKDGPTIVWSGQGLNTDASIAIPGGVLAPNHAYDLFLRYETFQNYNNLTAYFPDALAAYTFRYETKVSLVTTVPGAGSCGVLGVWGVFLSRRRRG